MAAVWYTGRSDSITLTTEDWARVGINGAATVVWNKTNGYSIPRSSFTSAQLAFLATDERFNANAADGPRPGAAASTPDAPNLKRADLDALGIGPVQVRNRLLGMRPLIGRGHRATNGKNLVHPDAAGIQVTLNQQVGLLSWATRQYAVADLPNCTDLGEGLQATLGGFQYALTAFQYMPRSIKTVCNGSKFAWYAAGAPGANSFTLYVDGMKLKADPVYVPAAGAQFHQITFPAAKPGGRLIELRTSDGISAVYTDSPYECWRPQLQRGLRGLAITDSYGSNAGASQSMRAAFWNAIHSGIGCDQFFLDHNGGSGIGVTSGATGVEAPFNRYLDRIEPITNNGLTWDIATIDPHFDITWGGGANDKLKGRTNTQVIDDSLTYYRRLHERIPNSRHLSFEGVAPPGHFSTFNPDYIAIRTAVQAQLNSEGVPVYFIDVATTKPWIRGTGWVGNAGNNENSTLFISNDTDHPSDAGHEFIAGRVIDKVWTCLTDDGSLAGQLI